MIGLLRSRLRRSPCAPAPEQLFVELAGARPESGYSAADRRRDFRAVLLGSPAGRRVLYEILAWAHVFASTFVPGDACATHWREGGRDVGLRILAALAPEPPAASGGAAGRTDDGEAEARPGRRRASRPRRPKTAPGRPARTPRSRPPIHPPPRRTCLRRSEAPAPRRQAGATGCPRACTASPRSSRPPRTPCAPTRRSSGGSGAR